MTSDVILQVLKAKSGKWLNSTRLVKLVYLIDYTYFRYHGSTLTGLRYMWDFHGPNALGHAIVEEANSLAKQGTIKIDQSSNIYGGITTEYRFIPNAKVPTLEPEAELIVGDMVRKYGSLSTTRITAISKETEPFKTAKQYDLLEMKKVDEISGTTAEDYKSYKEQEEKEGLASLGAILSLT